MEKRHIGVYGILQKASKILLILKTRGPYTGKLDLPGGGLHHGERIEDALSRELNEEVGLPYRSARINFFDTTIYMTDYQENGSLISFYHIGLLYKVTDFKEEDLCLSIKEEDVHGGIWADFSIEEQKLSPFAFYAIKKIRPFQYKV